MKGRDLLFGLNEIQGVGWRTIDKICKAGLLAETVFSCRQEDFERAGLSPAIARLLTTALTRKWIEERHSLIEENQLGMLTILDEEYPNMLKESAEPPWVLYYRGRLELLSSPGIAMVGTRVPTAYGRKVGGLLADELSSAGFTIISGLARGIDSVCHEAALSGRGSTIAVMATGMDKVYPPENRELLHAISRQGLVLTEYPMGTPSHPGLFPRRNRIIAGLSLGTVVVEADLRSGSLITADVALETGRDVFAVPGPVTSPKSRGALELIKQGAKVVTGSADIVEEYRSCLPESSEKWSDEALPGEGGSITQVEKKLTSDELQLYHILHQGPFTLDELLARSRWDFGHLHSVLLSLIIKKEVVQLPGAIYKII